MNSNKLFQRDFTMVVIGQIISLFGNSILRLALPLYLLNQTNSAALFGVVSACSFIPMIILSPIGGIIADRVNKRNIMVVLDFSTALLMIIFSLLLGKMNLIVLLMSTLIILYGIQGAYQPAVQASIPVLASTENLMPANAVINLVSSLAGLIGPVIGGTLYSIWGLRPILVISIICFIFSAVMEIFIHIPFKKQMDEKSVWQIVKSDMGESIVFMKKEKPIIWKMTFLVASINMFFSSLIIIGLPVIVTTYLDFSQQLGNQLYSYAEAALAAGGLVGGILAGVVGKKMKVQKAYVLLFGCTFTLLPLGIALCVPMSSAMSYIIILISCFAMMVLSSLFSIEGLAYVQEITPTHLIGKIMALLMCICMCAQPIGQAMYGILFEVMKQKIYLLFFGVTALCVIISYISKEIFKEA